MKNSVRRIFLIAQLILVPLFMTGVFADPPGPPGPGGDPGASGGVPVGAPFGDGIFILLTLAVTYGSFKLYQMLKARRAAAKQETV
jgi:hypothetical protein